jgi:hypothetical protein
VCGRQPDERAEAHQLLAEIYGWFTEGFDTKDLQEASTGKTPAYCLPIALRRRRPIRRFPRQRSGRG